MKLKKIALAAAVSGAVGFAGTATAAITGVPGEGLLVPMVLNSGVPGDALAESYVAIVVPTDIGQDTVPNMYTAPNTAPGDQEVEFGDEIYWVLYDEESKVIEDGTCEISLGDKVVWTTDQSTYGATQEAQRDASTGFGAGMIPNPVCGPSNDDWFAGYVVFMTKDGADGKVANFAMTGDAWVIENVLTASLNANMASVPVIPLADGDDAASLGVTGGVPAPINLPGTPGGQNEIVLSNTPKLYNTAPIAAGNRMNNGAGPGFATQRILMQADVRGPATGDDANDEQSLHVFWFDQNNEDRTTPVEIWDDAEGSCTSNIYLPYELNILLFNNGVDVSKAPAGWDNMQGSRYNDPNRLYTDVIGALSGDYVSARYCAPTYWNPRDNLATPYPGALNGYIEYRFFEEYFGDAPLLVNGAAVVDSAGVAFNWQESLDETVGVFNADTAWSSHMTQYLGASVSTLSD